MRERLAQSQSKLTRLHVLLRTAGRLAGWLALIYSCFESRIMREHALDVNVYIKRD